MCVPRLPSITMNLQYMLKIIISAQENNTQSGECEKVVSGSFFK